MNQLTYDGCCTEPTIYNQTKQILNIYEKNQVSIDSFLKDFCYTKSNIEQLNSMNAFLKTATTHIDLKQKVHTIKVDTLSIYVSFYLFAKVANKKSITTEDINTFSKKLYKIKHPEKNLSIQVLNSKYDDLEAKYKPLLKAYNDAENEIKVLKAKHAIINEKFIEIKQLQIVTERESLAKDTKIKELESKFEHCADGAKDKKIEELQNKLNIIFGVVEKLKQ